MGGSRGGSGLQPPPPPPPPPKMVWQSYSIECSVIDVPSHARALIYIVKSLVVVVVSSKHVVLKNHSLDKLWCIRATVKSG